MRPDNLCIYCKGTKNLCGVSPCPVLQKVKASKGMQEKLKQDVFGPSPPNLFVGSYGWPNVNWGPMVSIGEGSDNPSDWYGASYDDIINWRSSIVRGQSRANVLSREHVLREAQEAAMSIRNVDMEMSFTKKPVYEMKFSSVTQPMGASAPMKRMKVVDNPKIPRRVDQLVEDGVMSRDAVHELFEKGYDNYYLTRLLNAGVLGRKKYKKLVPTRWSITAMDDMVGKRMMQKIREFREIGEYQVYTSEYLHNHFEILLMPGAWEFEQFESWAPGTIWSQGESNFRISEEYEPFEGRWKYADKQAGGYYAGRYGVCEGLLGMRRQARSVVFREVYEGYMVPVGVWEVRENARNAMKNPPKKFQSMNEALEDIGTRLRIPIKEYRRMSRIIAQTRLLDF